MKIFHFLPLVCALVLWTCSPSSATPVQILPTAASTFLPDETASPTLAVISTLTPTLVFQLTPALPYGITPDQISPILYTSYPNFILLGASAGDRWLSAEEVHGVLQQEKLYAFYMPDVKLDSGMASVNVPENQGPPGACDYYYVNLSSFVIAGTPPTYGFRSGQPVVFRPVEEIPTSHPFYQQFVAEWLVLQDVPDPVVNITRILRVDIEGDGVDEVMIAATHFKDLSGHMVETGDFSFVLMRKVVEGTVYTIPLASVIYYEKTPSLRFPPAYWLENIFDLNGDGKLEVIVSGRWWEGQGVFVYEIHGAGADEALRVTCGLVNQD